VQPVLSPDNYVDVATRLLENAQQSIEIEQQYIKGWQPIVGSLCEAIARARGRNPNLEVRIILAAGFEGAGELDRQLDSLEEFAGATRGTEVRVLNPAHFVHCHNKLLIVDRQHVLISSQNWSDFAVSKNREAGLLLDYADLAQYYGEIFDADWNTARIPDERGRLVREMLAPEMAVRGRPYVRAVRADFEAV
jgi:phosphatidylserine/phosphatidylglycerophosphate/cardiolipin synthase-like enzyme